MIAIHEALQIHAKMVESFGGIDGTREEGLLMAALARPYAGFGDTEFYPTPQEKAAAMVESILKNHPFLDGNKRTGYALMLYIIRKAGFRINASQDEKYDFIIDVASSKIAYAEILAWLNQHTH